MANASDRPVEAGRLRHPLTFQALTVTQDSFGGIVETWADEFTTSGSIEPLRGREYWEAQKANSEISGKIYIRWQTGISPTMRITTPDGRTFHIVHFSNHGERRKLMEIHYREDLQ